MISAAIATAFESLPAGVAVGDLEADGVLGGARFRCRLSVAQPNPEGLPPTVDFDVHVPAWFPASEVEFIPVDPCVSGFPHQNGLTRALCLRRDGHYPVEGPERLQAYVESAGEWLSKAAAGTLLAPHERWELPDFRTAEKQLAAPLFQLESAASYEEWRTRIGQFGLVQFSRHAKGPGLVTTRFDRPDGTTFVPRVMDEFVDRRVTTLGAWLLLPTHVVSRHRPARTFDELDAQCRSVGVNLVAVLKRAQKVGEYQGFHYLLVGAPIPVKVAGEYVEIHWQPIAFPVPTSGPLVRGTRRSTRTREEEGAHNSRVRGFLACRAVPWGRVKNVAPARVEKRGVLEPEAAAASFTIIGCGAIGSALANHLARGAVRSLNLFDGDDVELENLVRHELSAADVGKNKATALAERLNGIHPLCRVRAFPITLPLPPRVPRSAMKADAALTETDVFIDCTASASQFAYWSHRCREEGRRLIRVYVNAYARMLTIVASGRHAAAALVEEEFCAELAAGSMPFKPEEHSPAAEEVVPGAGCWASTFPARGSDIAALVAAAIPLLETLICQPCPSQGEVLVLRRRDADSITLNEPNMIELAWRRAYR